MIWIDTHAHIYFESMNKTIGDIIQDCRNENVHKILMPAVDIKSMTSILKVSKQYPQICFAMAGLHPCYINENYQEQLHKIEIILNENEASIYAIGEIGLDFYHDITFKKQQESAFSTQIDWASKRKIPISIHSRNAEQATWDILESKAKNISGVFHCYSGDYELAKKIVNKGFYLGIGGTFTFKKNQLIKEVVKKIGLEYIILETDAPYLAPVPHRGKTNHPSFIPIIGKTIAEELNIPIEIVANTTSLNATHLFNLNKSTYQA